MELPVMVSTGEVVSITLTARDDVATFPAASATEYSTEYDPGVAVSTVEDAVMLTKKIQSLSYMV